MLNCWPWRRRSSISSNWPHANDVEIARLDNICRDELKRLRAEEGILADDDHWKRSADARVQGLQSSR